MHLQAARENYEKWGHPDGRQTVEVGVALPTFLFGSRHKTLMLAVLVIVGILTPMFLAMWYLRRSGKKTSSGVRIESVQRWAHPESPVSLKPAMALSRILDCFVWAVEFEQLPCPGAQREGIEQLLKTLSLRKVILDRDKFIKRKTPVFKAHLLYLAHLERVPVPPALQEHFCSIIRQTPVLMEELMKVACLPRIRPWGYGWMTPSVAVVETMQCLAQGVSPMYRQPTLAAAQAGGRKGRGGGGGAGGGEHLSPLLQLPHVEEATARALVKKAKVKNLEALQALDAGARAEALGQAGLSAAQVGKVEEALDTVPKVTMTAEHSTYGEAEILNGDPVTVTVRLVLRRRAHAALTKALNLRGQKVLASTPRLPNTRPEAWYILLVDPATNYLFCWQRVSLDEAEEIGMEEAIRARKTGGAAEPAGDGGEGAGRAQVVKMQFRAPPPGKYEPLLLCMSNAWIGCDAALGIGLDVDKEAKPKPEKGQDQGAGAADAAGIMSDLEFSDDESELDEEMFDSDETGTDISEDDWEALEYVKLLEKEIAAKQRKAEKEAKAQKPENEGATAASSSNGASPQESKKTR